MDCRRLTHALTLAASIWLANSVPSAAQHQPEVTAATTPAWTFPTDFLPPQSTDGPLGWPPVRTEIERQASIDRIRKLAEENEALIEEVQRFRTDMEYVESVARKELNLIRENEVIYRLGKGKTGKE